MNVEERDDEGAVLGVDLLTDTRSVELDSLWMMHLTGVTSRGLSFTYSSKVGFMIFIDVPEPFLEVYLT